MKYIICKSADIERKLVDEEIKLENDIVLFPVEVLVCNNCGEDITMQLLCVNLK